MGFKTIKKVLDRKYDVLELGGVWGQVLGRPESNGLWLLYGPEKMGKTTIALMLADELRRIKKRVGYVMAEQGFDIDFNDLIVRLSIGIDSKLKVSEYMPIEELDHLMKKKNQIDVVFIDNITVYMDELKRGKLRKFISDNPKKLIIMLAHEEKGDVYTATGRLAKKLAKRIIRVDGNIATVEGRTDGGHIIINHDKAMLYHGSQINNELNNN